MEIGVKLLLISAGNDMTWACTAIPGWAIDIILVISPTNAIKAILFFMLSSKKYDENA